MLARNTKITIDKTLVRIPSNRFAVASKIWAEEVKQINKGLAPSVLFKDIEIDPETHEKIIQRLRNKIYPDLQKLPFNDFCILTDLVVDDNDEIDPGMVKKDAILVRYTRSKTENQVLYITTYLRTDDKNPYITLNIKALDLVSHKYDLVAYDKEFKRDVIDKSPTMINSEMMLAMVNLAALQHFEPVKIPYAPTFSERKHIPSNMRDKYFEYTLNLTKPLKVKWSKSKHLGGSHASPCEHTRRGHYRTYKSGKRVWVEGIIVNKGSKTGKIEKDYSLQAS